MEKPYKVLDHLHDRTRRKISPVRPRRERSRPARQRARVRPAGHDPRRVLRITLAARIKGQLDRLRKVNIVLDGVLEREVRQRLGRQRIVRARVAPVAVLHHDDGAADRLGEHAGDGAVRQVARVRRGGDLARVEEDDGRAGPGPELRAPPVVLREGAQGGLVVVDELLEGGVAEGGRALRGFEVEVFVDDGRGHGQRQAAGTGYEGQSAVAGEQQQGGEGEEGLHLEGGGA